MSLLYYIKNNYIKYHELIAYLSWYKIERFIYYIISYKNILM